MRLTASDVESLSNALTWWERAEYFFTAWVVLACAGEYIASFTNWFSHGNEEAKKRLEKKSTLVLIAALALELLCLVKTNSLSGMLIGSLSDKAAAAATKAQSALDKSATAETSASKAEATSGQALGTAGKAQEEADKADRSARKAQGKADAVGDKADALTNQLATAKQQLESVENKRAELEKSLRNLAVCTSPRVIPVWSMSSSQTGARRFNDALVPYSRWKVLIEYVPNDAETFRAASSLAKAFGSANWDVSPPQPDTSGAPFTDGVEVQGYELSLEEWNKPPSMLDMVEVTHNHDVASEVVIFLHSYNWEATLGWESPQDTERKVIPRQGIKIRVGLYPPVWYVAPPAMKDLYALNAEFEKERREREQKAEQAMRESNTKLFSQLQNPELVARLKAEEQREEQARKAAMQPRINPCQPLEPLPVR